MSDPTGAEPQQARLTASRVVGVACGLALIGWLGWALAGRGARAIDGAAALAERFAATAPPQGLVIEQAHALPDGTRVVVLADGAAGAEPAAAPAPAERADFERVELGEAGALPRRVLITLYEASAPAAAIAAQFEVGDWRQTSSLGPGGGLVTVEKGRLPWGPWEAEFVHERLFEPGGSFRDAVRVNLSLPEKPCVLNAFWTRGQRASRAVLEQLLSDLPAR